MEWFSFNGKYVEAGSAIITADSRGLRFGDGIFETLRVVDGKQELAQAHYARFWKGLAALQFRIPVHFTAALLEEQVDALLKKNGHLATARVRVTAFRSDGGLYDPADQVPNIIIQSWALPGDRTTWNSNGLILGIYTQAKKTVDSFSNLKHNNFLPYSMAALHARSQKWNDALLLNCYNRICDTSMANIFFIKDGKIFTPALAEGCIAGITRQFLIDKLRSLGYTVEEGSFSTEDLLASEEIFLTNSIYHMRWVQAIEEKKFNNRLSAKINTEVFSTIR